MDAFHAINNPIWPMVTILAASKYLEVFPQLHQQKVLDITWRAWERVKLENPETPEALTTKTTVSNTI